jgi:peptidoglycan/LPS O-acetylase OafA/YrhL
MRSSSGQHFEKLDHLRFLAALIVLFWHGLHYQKVIPTSYVPAWSFFSLLEEGHTGVSLFMVLSGYIFWQLCRLKKIDYLGFIYNRFVRIAPLFLLYTLLMFKVSDIDPVKLFVSIFGLLGHTVMGVSWTVIVEFQFYLAFPFILLFTQKYGFRYVFGILFMAIIIRSGFWLTRGQIQDISYWTIFGRIDQFLVGILVCEAVNRWNNNKILKGLVASIFILSIYGFHLFNKAGGFYDMPTYPSPSPLWIVMPTFEAIMWGALTFLYLATKFELPVKLSRTLSWCGTISFSIYFTHFFVIEVFSIIAKKADINISGTWMVGLIVLFVLLPVIIGLSSITYLLIEKPFLELRKNYIVKNTNYPIAS